MKKVRATVRFKGRVQGVGFRYFTCAEATKEGVTGWVRNRANGEVEAVFEGRETAIRQILKRCQQGPSGSDVTEMLIDWEHCTDAFSCFEIQR